MRMKEIHTLPGTRSRPALTRDPALDTRTHSALEDPCTPHSDTTLRYTRTLLPDTHCEDPRTLHSDTQAPLYPDTTLGYTLPYTRTVLSDTPELRIRAPVPCAPTLHHFTVRAPDSCSLKDEHTSNSWSVLRIRVVFLLMLQLFFFLTNHCSHPEVRMLLLRNLVPFRFCSKTSESLKAHKLLLSITAPFLFLRLRSLTSNSHRSRLSNPISTQKASTVAVG